MWDPVHYLRYADERGRPFADLVSRIDATSPRRVVDLGCGPGNLTVTLAQRWPDALIEGVDSSLEMIEKASTLTVPGHVEFRHGDLREWHPAEPVDVLVSNAALQWVPSHLDLLRRLVGHVVPGGWLAFQVPGTFGGPSHVILRDLAAEPRWGLAGRITSPSSEEPATYAAALAGLGCRIDVWETTYLHVLDGPDPVYEWISGTGARPMLAALDATRRTEFVEVLKERLRAAYPPAAFGTLLPFRRIFAVAQRKADQ